MIYSFYLDTSCLDPYQSILYTGKIARFEPFDKRFLELAESDCIGLKVFPCNENELSKFCFTDHKGSNQFHYLEYKLPKQCKYWSFESVWNQAIVNMLFVMISHTLDIDSAREKLVAFLGETNLKSLIQDESSSLIKDLV